MLTERRKLWKSLWKRAHLLPEIPMQPYTLAGKIADATDKYAIDATVLHHGGNRYLVWSGREADVSGCQKLYIAQMGDPKTLISERVMISTPEYEWDRDANLEETHSAAWTQVAAWYGRLLWENDRFVIL